MHEFKKSNFAANKYKEGIVYHFVDGSTVEITLTDYLSDNPDKNERDFIELKELSDQIYYEQVLEENRYQRRKTSLGKIEGKELFSTPSLYIQYEQRENIKRISETAAALVLDEKELTEVQRRRFVLHFIEGFSYRKIADFENVHFTSVQESIEACIKKLNKKLKNF